MTLGVRPVIPDLPPDFGIAQIGKSLNYSPWKSIVPGGTVTMARCDSTITCCLTRRDWRRGRAISRNARPGFAEGRLIHLTNPRVGWFCGLGILRRMRKLFGSGRACIEGRSAASQAPFRPRTGGSHLQTLNFQPRSAR